MCQQSKRSGYRRRLRAGIPYDSAKSTQREAARAGVVDGVRYYVDPMEFGSEPSCASGRRVKPTLPRDPHADGSTALISLYLCWRFSLRRHSRQSIRVRLRETKGHNRRSSDLCLLRKALRALLLLTFLSGPVDTARSGSLVGIARTSVCCTEA
jgi:hypothetical protein